MNMSLLRLVEATHRAVWVLKYWTGGKTATGLQVPCCASQG